MEALEVRAAKFAALSEPARLRIVDMLALGDLSPTEVQVALGMPSNLVAHHLGVLESAGVVSRSRSESDGRRNYVRLVPGTFSRLAPGPMTVPSRVVFVCTANSARSQIAAALWRDMSAVPVASAGTQPGDAVNESAIRVAERHGLVIVRSAPRSVSDVVGEQDFIVTVCDRAHEQLGGSDDLHWSVPDPARVGTDAAFDTALQDLRIRVDALVTRVLPAAS